jgi:hypothetical protein
VILSCCDNTSARPVKAESANHLGIPAAVFFIVCEFHCRDFDRAAYTSLDRKSFFLPATEKQKDPTSKDARS